MVPKVYGKYLPSVYTALLGAEIYFSYTFGLKKLLPTWEDGALELGVVGQGETALGSSNRFGWAYAANCTVAINTCDGTFICSNWAIIAVLANRTR